MSSHYEIPDRESFVKIPRGIKPEGVRFIGHLFATDGRSVFSTRGALKDVEAMAFHVVAESSEPGFHGCFVSAYAVTGSKALYVDELNAPRFFKMQEESNLRVLAPHFATDGSSVFCDGVRITGAEPDSFKSLSSDYSVDSRYCYFRSKRIAQADPASFEILGEKDDWHLHLSYDASSLYHFDQPVVKLSGFVPELRRCVKRRVSGVFDGTREWTTFELETLYRNAIRPVARSVVLAEDSSSRRYTDDMFAGLDEELSMFLLLCSHRSIASLEEFTRGKRGEKAVVRAIDRLNSKLPVQLAIVSPAAITITSDGIAAYRQYGQVVDVIGSFLASLR